MIFLHLKEVNQVEYFVAKGPGAPINQMISFGNLSFSGPYFASSLFQTLVNMISGSLISKDLSSGSVVSAVMLLFMLVRCVLT